MKISIKNKKTEAIRRMKALGIFEYTIKDFEDNDRVSLSEPPAGAYYWADEETQEIIKKLEEKYDILIYTGTRSFIRIGEDKFTLDTFLFVGDEKREWKEFDEELKDMRLFGFCANRTDDMLSEFGYADFELGEAAGLIRKFS